MFQPSSQQFSFHQQIIGTTKEYPCPRCAAGALTPFGHTETFICRDCKRNFVPLNGARLLYPAQTLGWKIAPTYWWDGRRWHWAGTTATTRQLITIVLISLLPGLVIDLAIAFNIWSLPVTWCNPLLLGLVVGLISMQIAYLICWDFDFASRFQR